MIWSAQKETPERSEFKFECDVSPHESNDKRAADSPWD